MSCSFFFFQAEDGIRDAQESRGLGDVYKRQLFDHPGEGFLGLGDVGDDLVAGDFPARDVVGLKLSLIHI